MRHSKWDALLVALSLLHAAVLLAAPSVVVIAIGLWWSSNTVSHNFVHLPFFRSASLNRCYSVYLSLLTGVPQSLWRSRHLAHHGAPVAGFVERDAAGNANWRPLQQRVETGAVLLLWALLASLDAKFFLTVYVPGFLTGLALCYVHGRFEHARGTISYYGALYNLVFFNDGYHVEHHGSPRAHWTRLPVDAQRAANPSRWPAIIRWLAVVDLDSLERCVARSAMLQRFVLRSHERALRTLLPKMPQPHTVRIVGGGIFPRTALILQRLLPDARITIVDASVASIATARGFLGETVQFQHATYDAGADDDADLVVIPLAFVGDREAAYRRRAAGPTLVHDWLWARRGEGARVSLLLLKRLNLVLP